MLSRFEQRLERIKEQIPIVEVLQRYGYQVYGGGGDREQQFSCDLHGDGTDNKPSARAYPESASFYCFACDKTYDAINIVRIKENATFGEACRILEQWYGLPYLPWADEGYEKPLSPEEEISKAFVRSADYETEKRRVRSLLDAQTRDRDLPRDTILKLWEAFDKFSWMVDKERWNDKKGQNQMQKLRAKVQEKIEEHQLDLKDEVQWIT